MVLIIYKNNYFYYLYQRMGKEGGGEVAKEAFGGDGDCCFMEDV